MVKNKKNYDIKKKNNELTKEKLQKILTNTDLSGGNYSKKEIIQLKIENDVNDAIKRYLGNKYQNKKYKIQSGGDDSYINVEFNDDKANIDLSNLNDEEFKSLFMEGGSNFLKRLQTYFTGVRSFNKWFASFESSKQNLRDKINSYNVELKRYETVAKENASALQDIYTYSKKIIIIDKLIEEFQTNVELYADGKASLEIERNKFFQIFFSGRLDEKIFKGVDKGKLSNMVRILQIKNNRLKNVRNSKEKGLLVRNKRMVKKLKGERKSYLLFFRDKPVFDVMMKELMSSVQSFNSVAGKYVDYVKTITIGREYRATYEKLKGEDKTKISAEQRKEIKLYQKNKEKY